ncbi:uracil phosphoribosyltransferase [Phycisphaera mikurensis NBRC 102666]|uniref:Uracil phosphoribosyltransferase n=1 Tax=Phycisphaera mikurensis (strain NBRC 102666 / KCTC 22515 / FYK2301M01) TaxID=1142394 RepID=I0IFG0_PHYMF|nr:uracil phosphoribosyltransferase [Phycisphaera mikurensis NBRC 102666]
MTVLDHPLVGVLVTELRDERTPVERFREVVEQLGRLLAYEALREVRVREKAVRTPVAGATGTRLAASPTVVCILRAGAGLTPGVLSLIPGARMGHLGMARDEATLEPRTYYDKLPPDVADGPVLLCDPMLATGGSAVAAVELLAGRGCRDVTFLGVIAAPEGVKRLTEAHPEVPLVLAALDERLDGRGYIVPGLGDAGDRIFGT